MGRVRPDDRVARDLFDRAREVLVVEIERAVAAGDELGEAFARRSLAVVETMREDIANDPRPAPEVIGYLERVGGRARRYR